THRFDQDAVEPERVEDIGDLFGGGCEATLRPAGRHRSNEDAWIEADRFHPDAIAEQCASGKGARRVHGDHSDLQAVLAIRPHQLLGERALAGARGARDADALRAPLAKPLVDRRQDTLEALALILDEADRARERRRVAS